MSKTYEICNTAANIPLCNECNANAHEKEDSKSHEMETILTTDTKCPENTTHPCESNNSTTTNTLSLKYLKYFLFFIEPDCKRLVFEDENILNGFAKPFNETLQKTRELKKKIEEEVEKLADNTKEIQDKITEYF